MHYLMRQYIDCSSNVLEPESKGRMLCHIKSVTYSQAKREKNKPITYT